MPKRFQLIDIHLFQRLIGDFFHAAEPRFEPARGFAQRGFRIDVEMPRIIDDAEQQVAKLGFAFVRRSGRIQFLQLFEDLGARA